MYSKISNCLFCFLVSICGHFAESDSKTIEDVKLNQQAITLNETCVTSSECAGKLLCYDGVCSCALGHFWSGADCLLKKTYRESCGSSDECRDTFICNGTCQCSETDYWDGHTCSTKKPAFAECASTMECRDTLYCSRHICQCFATDYWTGTSCSLKKGIDSPCSSSLECRDTLRCVGNNCTCDESEFWNGTFCVGRKRMNMDCSISTECREEIVCLRNNCQCSVSYFWDGNNCEKKKTNGQTCKESLDCEDPLKCILETCQCNTTQYWSGKNCLQRKPIDSSCVSSNECKENLYCTVNKRCRCKSSYYWDGLRCSLKLPRECSDIDANKDGVYSIYPGGGRKMSVYCVIREHEKWTVIQRRSDGSVDFKRSWREFKYGFGSSTGEYWLGNDIIHLLSADGYHELSVYLEDRSGNIAYANYSSFRIENEARNYKLRCSGYSGNAGDSFCGQVNNMYFSTYDDDNQGDDCPQTYGGVGWWYYDKTHRYGRYTKCKYYAAVNGKYGGWSSNGFGWYHWTSNWNRPLKSSVLMIRRK